MVPGKVDRGGAINTIAPNGLTSKNCCGQATSGYLVDVQRVKNEEWEAWRRDHPEAFARKSTTKGPACVSTPGSREAD